MTIVVGGQYGGEGKGKVCAYLAATRRYGAVCRLGGPNSSHTVCRAGRLYRLRQLPVACIVRHPKRVFLGAGALIHVPTLLEELAITSLDPRSLLIDRQAGVISGRHVGRQQRDVRYQRIGSTLTGTGYASADRCLRRLRLARETPALRSFLGDVSCELAALLAAGEDVLVEGRQGFRLSNFHGDYPYCTSQDTTASAALAELGVGPRVGLQIILVVKVFPTRNHGGVLPGEMAMADADRLGIVEYGGGSFGVGDRRRRVGRSDLRELQHAVWANTPTEIALTGVDYLDVTTRGARDQEGLPSIVLEYIQQMEHVLGVPVRFVSTGPETDQMIDLEVSAPSRKLGLGKIVTLRRRKAGELSRGWRRTGSKLGSRV